MRCECCGRAVPDTTTDFGGLILEPAVGGIHSYWWEWDARKRRYICTLTREELQSFLDRAYGVEP